MNLENLGLVELNAQEVQEVEGGFLPAIVIGVCWGIMLCSAAVAAGIAHANGLQPAWKK
jgi:lactobin A/cerein 7B family class IIb bacteriocin